MKPSSTREELERHGITPLETADYELFDAPLRGSADVRDIEKVAVDTRIGINNFSKRVDIALKSRNPDDVAIYYVADGDINTPAQTVSFHALRRDIDATAALLKTSGHQRSDVTAILLPAVPSIYWAILGAMRAGIVFPVNWMLESRHLLHLLKESGATRIIALGPTPGFKIWESLMSIVGELPDSVRVWSVQGPGGTVLEDSDLNLQLAKQGATDDPSVYGEGSSIAAYVHSGGTTGLPKIVKLSHRNMSFRHWTLQLMFKAVPGEIIIHDVPMFHVGGLTGRCLPPLASGASVLIPSVMGARDKRYMSNYWKFVAKYRVTRLSGVPTTLAVLAKSPPQGDDLSSLKPYFIVGSTAMPVAVREAFERVSGVRVLNSYGMTENTASIAIDPRDGPPRDGASGIRLPYTDIRAAVMDANGKTTRICARNEIGMLQIRSPGLTPGYLNPKHDQAARTDDGWLITGDLGRIDNDDYVFVTGRAKDVIIRGGHNIDPALIEEPLAQAPDVLIAAAVGKPDAYAGELPVAYVQLSAGSKATNADLLAFLEGRITERAAVPKEIHIVEQMPLTDIGKPKKNVLRDMAAEREFGMILGRATGLPDQGTGPRLQVRVLPHAVHGTQVDIHVYDVSASQQPDIEAQIHAAMAPFAHARAVTVHPAA